MLLLLLLLLLLGMLLLLLPFTVVYTHTQLSITVVMMRCCCCCSCCTFIDLNRKIWMWVFQRRRKAKTINVEIYYNCNLLLLLYNCCCHWLPLMMILVLYYCLISNRKYIRLHLQLGEVWCRLGIGLAGSANWPRSVNMQLFSEGVNKTIKRRGIDDCDDVITDKIYLFWFTGNYSKFVWNFLAPLLANWRWMNAKICLLF